MSDEAQPAEPAPAEEPRTSSRTRWGVSVGAVVAIGLAAAFAAWLLVERDDDDSSTRGPVASTPVDTSAAVARPALATVAELRAAAASSPVPIYWVGGRNGRQLELTQAPGGTTFVRYLPGDAAAGDTRAFLTVATYPRADAFAEVRDAAKASKSTTIPLAGGGIAIYDPDHPTNLHLAYPEQPYQIEVFAPEAGFARQLVSSGAVRPVG